MMFPADTLEGLKDLSQQAITPKLIDIDQFHKLKVVPGEKPVVIEVKPRPIARRLDTFDAFVTYVAERKDLRSEADKVQVDFPDDIAHDGSSVFYSDKEFVYVEQPNLNNGLRASFQLVKLEPFKWLELNCAKFLNQPEFVRLLRITLRDYLMPGDNLLTIVREVKFNSGSAGTGNIQHGKQSLSREIINEVKGTGAIPEDITLQVQPFENLPFKSNVDCAVEIDESACAFRLSPFPGQLRKCLDSVLRMAWEKLDAIGVPAHQGATN